MKYLSPSLSPSRISHSELRLTVRLFAINGIDIRRGCEDCSEATGLYSPDVEGFTSVIDSWDKLLLSLPSCNHPNRVNNYTGSYWLLSTPSHLLLITYQTLHDKDLLN